MKAETTSVPPLMEATGMCSPTLSRNQSDDDEGSEEPVMPISRSAVRS